MKIKSRVWHWMAVACGSAGLVLGMSAECTAQTGGAITDGEFVTAMVLILLGLLLMRFGFAAEVREQREKRKIHREPMQTVQGNRSRRNRRAG